MSGQRAQELQKGLQRLPRWAIVPLFTIVFTVWLLVLQLLRGNVVTWVDVAIVVPIAFIGGLLAWWIRNRREARAAAKPAGWPTPDRFESAVSSGRLPEGANAEQWMPKLRQMAAQERHMVWIGPLLFAAFSALGVYLALDDPAHPWFGLLVSVAFAAMAVLYPRWSMRRRRRLQQLMDQFTGGATSGHAL